MFCSNCGCEVSENSKFCSECGSQIVQNAYYEENLFCDDNQEEKPKKKWWVILLKVIGIIIAAYIALNILAIFGEMLLGILVFVIAIPVIIFAIKIFVCLLLNA